MSVADLAKSIKQTLEQSGSRLSKPVLRKLSEACAGLLHAKSVNTFKIGLALPGAPESISGRELWINRLLASRAFSESDALAPFARADLAAACEGGQRPILCMDQTELGDRHAVLMLALRVGERAIPLCWHVEPGSANIGSAKQIELLETVLAWLPAGAKPILMGDRFYPSQVLFSWLGSHGFGWRLRLKGNAELSCSDGRIGQVADLARRHPNGGFFDGSATIYASATPTGVAWIWDQGHKEGWAIAMDCKPTRAAALDYGCRWGIETMFSDFKSRGFDLQKSQMKLPERLSKMVLLVALAMRMCMAAAAEASKKSDENMAASPR